MFTFLLVIGLSQAIPEASGVEPLPTKIEAPTDANGTTLKNGTDMFHDTSYYWEFNEDLQNWYQADIICRERGGILANINDVWRNNDLLMMSYSRRIEGYFWHGGNDLGYEGIYMTDFYSNNYLTWSPIWTIGEPNGGRDQNCLLVYLGADVNAGRWLDTHCTARYPYICEMW